MRVIVSPPGNATLRYVRAVQNPDPSSHRHGELACVCSTAPTAPTSSTSTMTGASAADCGSDIVPAGST
ncbi:unnamed protein product [Ciceribacter selenitireducens ATCC BAA-1503]|uniref:Uncharacterized protein n=1 Tax=Ciceribacter selenitireducens ATCC BAA-1503 TaxID=1336235 RepID=A0A376AHN0_9HYPH|nr:unnamed protein product [Ciceribacter selenitireducens ATCC BAA-1503]